MIAGNLLRLAAFFTAVGLAACGGGGGGEAETEVVAPPPPPAEPPGPRLTVFASTVIGQASFLTGQPNQGGAVGGKTLHTPIGNAAVADDGKLFVADASNGRVLAYDTVPSSDGAPADLVIGKQDVTTPAAGTASREFIETPVSVSISGGQMAIVDSGANRVLLYSTLPTMDGAPASFVVGQSSFTDRDPRGCFSHALNHPRSAVITSNDKLVVADSLNNRILIWSGIPQDNGVSADVVLGQQDFTHCTKNDADQDFADDGKPNAKTLNEPLAVWSDGQQLIVADSANHRVLIWNRIPADATQNFKAADVVLGQANFSDTHTNDPAGDQIAKAAPTATTLNFPLALHSDGRRLAVADTGNHRILVWNSIPTQSGTPPDRVIGQADFTRGAPNDADQDGAPDATPSNGVLNTPRGVLIHGSSLFVTDTVNHRVLVFPLAP